MDLSDDALVEAVRDRDQGAFGELHARYVKLLAAHLGRIVRDEAAADDLCQEAFIRAWNRIGQLDSGGAFRGWLFRIGTNLALNHVRTVTRRREDPLEPPRPWEEEGDARLPDWMIDRSARSPDAGLEEDEREAVYRRLLDGLSEEKRETFRMAVDAELETREIAARLGIPEGTVKSRVFHARKALAAGWQRAFKDPED